MYIYILLDVVKGTPALPGVVAQRDTFWCRIKPSFWASTFQTFLGLGSVLSSILAKCYIISPSLFDHRFRIDFSSMLVSLLMFF